MIRRHLVSCTLAVSLALLTTCTPSTEGLGIKEAPPPDIAESTTTSEPGEPGEPAETPPPDVPDAGPTIGWCCDCSSQIGEALACTPALEGQCVGEYVAWCELDAIGTTAACESACDDVLPDGWCCDCEEKIADPPHFECFRANADTCHADSGKSGEWCERIEGSDAPHPDCVIACNSPTYCCNCKTLVCVESDGLDCIDEGLAWCHAGPDYAFAGCWDQCESK